jgi:hypothetical protein
MVSPETRPLAVLTGSARRGCAEAREATEKERAIKAAERKMVLRNMVVLLRCWRLI